MKNTIVKTYKGERAAERGIESMRKRGYEVDQASARKVLWSPMTGVFTRKQKHTIVFHKTSETPLPPARPSAEKVLVDDGMSMRDVRKLRDRGVDLDAVIVQRGLDPR